MEKSLNNIISDICREFGVNLDLGNKIIQRLNEQFFFQLADISNMTFEIWKSLDLPINLFFILQEKLNQVTQKINIPTKSRITSSNQENVNQTIEIKKIQPSKIIYDHEEIPSPAKIDLPIMEDLKKSIEQKEYTQRLQSEPKNLDNLLESIVSELNIDRDSSKIEILKKIHTVIANIAANPKEEKFKKLKLISKFYTDFLQPYKSILKFLEFINFTKSKDNQSLEYNGKDDEINQVLAAFNKFLINKKIVQSQNDAYTSSIISTGTNPHELNKVVPKEDLSDLLRREKQRREEIIRSSTKVERKPKIFLIKDENMNRFIQSLTQADELEEPKHVDQEFYKRAMGSINENTERFVMRTRTELESLIKKPVYTKATLRIKFPNEIMFQSSFAMMEKIEEVYNTIRVILTDPSEAFYLFIPFPSKKFNDMKATIYSQNLAPSTLVYISFPNIDPIKQKDYQYIKSEFLEKFSAEYEY